MKKKLAIITVFIAIIGLAGCTKAKPAATTPPENQTVATEMPKATTSTQSATNSAVPSFAPTSDEDIKAIDKTMDQVNFNEYSDSSLDDLK